MIQNPQTETDPQKGIPQKWAFEGCLVRVYKNASVILVALIIAFAVFSLLRMAIYKVRPYERGLHLRGGSFIGIDQPGWHVQIPFVDTVGIINIVERANQIDKLAAMTADDVTMDISLLYTYRVTDPARYALEVTNPDVIVAGFVQGTLRDVVNTRSMNDVMHGRAEFNQELIAALQKKEASYGVQFVLIQIQSAAPPEQVVSAIKDKMVAEQLKEKSAAEAVQAKTLADSNFYTAQKQAEGEAYQMRSHAEAEAAGIELTSKARVDALRSILKELEGKGDLSTQYIQVLIAQELRDNSKWVITNGEVMPVLDLGQETPVGQ